MSRYSQFDQQPSFHDLTTLPHHEDHTVCVKGLISQPNELMDKIEFTPYEAKNYYPVVLTKLPAMIGNQQYHSDQNNMNRMEEAAFAHEKMKKDIARCWNNKKTIRKEDLLTLREFYSGKSLIYQKFASSHGGNYFATYTLSMSGMTKELADKTNKHKFMIRSTKTPLISQRSKTQRLISICKPQIDFNSNFESGNLYKVYQREYNQYDLILQNDINTKGNTQWFFFSVRNVPKGTTVKFNLVNLAKRYSLFEFGMKPAVFSMARFERRQVGWVRDGTKVNYKQSSELRKQVSQQPFYNLSFQYKFNYDGDVVYFSYSIPYTFNNLCSFLSNTIASKVNSKKVRVRNLGETLGGNSVTLFQLTNVQSRIDKKSIWILGRQHSGQVSSSFMAQGVINYLLSDSPQADYLMNHYVFRIVPMVNIDGVVHGNSRADLSGHDSNRKWAEPSRIYQPIVYSIKKMIEKDNVEMILDLHSHSRKLGTFFYCNSSTKLTNKIKIFPMMVCKNDQRFDYKSNRYRGGNNLTARRVFYQILNIPYIYTIESSLYGYQKQTDFRIVPYQPHDYRQMGASVLKTFAEMAVKKQMMGLQDQRLLLCNEQELEEEDNLWDQMNQADQIQSMGSDQDPAGDQLSKKQLDDIFQRKNKKSGKTKKKKEEPKATLRKKIEEIKKEQEKKPKKNDKQSIYKRLFSGRLSMHSKQITTALDFYKKPKPETRSFGCQVQIHQKAVLHKSSLNVQTSRDNRSIDKMFEKHHLFQPLCVVGQKVEDEFVINGNTVGIQIQMEKTFLKPRNEIMLQNKSISKRMLKNTPKAPTIFLHNDNNFLNKGDILHKAIKMLNNR